jgi:hypothetical protein
MWHYPNPTVDSIARKPGQWKTYEKKRDEICLHVEFLVKTCYRPLNEVAYVLQSWTDFMANWTATSERQERAINSFTYRLILTTLQKQTSMKELIARSSL